MHILRGGVCIIEGGVCVYHGSDIIILDILNSEIPDFQIMNIYNKKSLKENCNDWILNRILPHIKLLLLLLLFFFKFESTWSL